MKFLWLIVLWLIATPTLATPLDPPLTLCPQRGFYNPLCGGSFEDWQRGWSVLYPDDFRLQFAAGDPVQATLSEQPAPGERTLSRLTFDRDIAIFLVTALRGIYMQRVSYYDDADDLIGAFGLPDYWTGAFSVIAQIHAVVIDHFQGYPFANMHVGFSTAARTPVPEPTTLSLLGLGTLLLRRLARRG